MHIIRTALMRGLRFCALFVISTYISLVIDENVHKPAKMIMNDISSCRAWNFAKDGVFYLSF